MQDYTITKLSWHTRANQEQDFVDRARRRMKAVAHFLQSNGLTERVLLPDGAEPDEEFAIKTSDLTPDGLAFMKQAYSKWLKRMDKGQKPEDVTFLQKELAKLRGK